MIDWTQVPIHRTEYRHFRGTPQFKTRYWKRRWQSIGPKRREALKWGVRIETRIDTIDAERAWTPDR